MRLFAVETRLVTAGDSLTDVILESLNTHNLQLEDNDILALASKVVSYSEGRLARLNDVKPSEKAVRLAKKYSLKPEFAELVIREADKIYGGVRKAVLTLKSGVLVANAGIDNKNAPEGHVVLWPSDPEKSARKIRNELSHRTGKRVAVVIVDSGLMPFRIGTTGLALAVAGFKPLKDRRGDKDLHGRKIEITRHAVADDLASGAHLLMGESVEKTPIVLIRDAPVDFDDGVYGRAELMMPFEECIFMNTFLSASCSSKKA